MKIWTLADGKPVATITTPSEVKGIAFSPDGTRLAVAGADNRARLYSTDGTLLEFLPQPHFHFSRGFFCEGNGSDRREPDGRSVRPLFQHQMQNPVDQDAGLAGAGRGLHGEGAVRLARGPLAIELERDHSSSSKRPSTILI